MKLPEHVDPKTWADFAEHRREIRKRLTPTATDRLLALLEKHPATANDALRKSVQNGWTGVFPEGKSNGKPKSADDFRPEKYVPTSAAHLLSPSKGTHR